MFYYELFNDIQTFNVRTYNLFPLVNRPGKNTGMTEKMQKEISWQPFIEYISIT